jgi:hypothetical protein
MRLGFLATRRTCFIKFDDGFPKGPDIREDNHEECKKTHPLRKGADDEK